MNMIFYIIIPIVGFGILVFVHELGHFVMAKLFKIKVEVFSLGWGPKLIGFQGKETMYQIAWFPIGGFCKFKGDEMAENIEDMGKDPDSFYGAKPYKRLLVAFFGPFMNYAIAVLILGVLALGPHKELFLPSKVMLLDDISSSKEESPAKKGGMMTGDQIVKIDDKEIRKFQDISRFFVLKDIKEVTVYVKRNNEVIPLKINPKWNPETLMSNLGVTSYILPVVKYDAENKLINYLDLKDKDLITGIDDDYTDITDYKFKNFLVTNYSTVKKSVIHIKRNDQVIDKEIVFNEITHYVSKADLDKQMFYYDIETIPAKGFFSAMIQGFNDSNDTIVYSAIGLYTIIFKKTKNVTNQLGGPVRIGYMMSTATMEGFKDSVYEGIRSFLSMISMISLALAFFNLLPFPAVDGGHIIMNLYEIISRKKISMKVIYTINMIGFIILIALAVLIILPLDIINISKGG
jgi:regulator of sigma E protease